MQGVTAGFVSVSAADVPSSDRSSPQKSATTAILNLEKTIIVLTLDQAAKDSRLLAIHAQLLSFRNLRSDAAVKPACTRPRLITDGRFSGGRHGFVFGHSTPEAYVGGPLARIAVFPPNASIDMTTSPTRL